MSYYPQRPPVENTPEALKEWVDNELNRVQQSFNAMEFIRLKEFYSAPVKVFTGMIVLADGTSWDPGSGQGVYCYYNSQWNKLG